MKTSKYLLVIGLVFLFTGSQVLAQQPSAKKEYKFTIKANPLAALGGPFWVIIVPITGEYKLIGEYAFAKQMSFQLGASYIGPSVLINLDKIADTASVSGIKTSGLRFSGMLKYFLSRDLPAPQGFYIAPQFSFAKASLTNKKDPTQKVNAQKININACIGYQLITSGGFTLDIFTGMGYVKRDWSFEGNNTSTIFDLGKNKSGVNIPLGFSFGYAF